MHCHKATLASSGKSSRTARLISCVGTLRGPKLALEKHHDLDDSAPVEMVWPSRGRSEIGISETGRDDFQLPPTAISHWEQIAGLITTRQDQAKRDLAETDS